MSKVQFNTAVEAGVISQKPQDNFAEKRQTGLEVAVTPGIEVPLTQSGAVGLGVNAGIHFGGHKQDTAADQGITPAVGNPSESVNEGNDPWGNSSNTGASDPANPLPATTYQRYVGGHVDIGPVFRPIASDRGFYINPYLTGRLDGFTKASSDFLDPYAGTLSLKSQVMGGGGLRVGYEHNSGVGGFVNAQVLGGTRFYDAPSGAVDAHDTHTGVSAWGVSGGVSLNFSKLFGEGTSKTAKGVSIIKSEDIQNISIMDSQLNQEFKAKFGHDLIEFRTATAEDATKPGTILLTKVKFPDGSEDLVKKSLIQMGTDGKTFIPNPPNDKIPVDALGDYVIDDVKSFNPDKQAHIAFLQDHFNTLLQSIDEANRPTNLTTGRAIRTIIKDKEGNLVDAANASKKRGRAIELGVAGSTDNNTIKLGSGSLAQIVANYVVFDDALHAASGSQAQATSLAGFPSDDDVTRAQGLLGADKVSRGTGENGTTFLSANLSGVPNAVHIITEDGQTAQLTDIEIHADPAEDGSTVFVVTEKNSREIILLPLPDSNDPTKINPTSAEFSSYEDLLTVLRSLMGKLGQGESVIYDRTSTGAIKTIIVKDATVPAQITFKSGKSDFANITNKDELKKYVDAIRADEANIVGNIFVKGFASSTGWAGLADFSAKEHDKNRELANERAATIAEYLKTQFPDLAGRIKPFVWANNDGVEAKSYKGAFYTGDKNPRTDVSFRVRTATEHAGDVSLSSAAAGTPTAAPGSTQNKIEVTITPTASGVSVVPLPNLGGKLTAVKSTEFPALNSKLKITKDGTNGEAEIDFGFKWKTNGKADTLNLILTVQAQDGSTQEVKLTLKDNEGRSTASTSPAAGTGNSSRTTSTDAAGLGAIGGSDAD